MTGWIMPRHSSSLFWRYSFFIGLAVGLLAKGPLILILAGGAISLWLLFYPNARATLTLLPWIKGLTLTLVLSAPWYLAAEIKTPGFLNYFFVGEHFLRFVDPGWKGDLYGTAHQAPLGTIWYYWLQASFPWGLAALLLLLNALFKPEKRTNLRRHISDYRIGYFLAWGIFTPLFFTLSGNILWTYILPSLGGFSIVLAYAWPLPGKSKKAHGKAFLQWNASSFPILALLAPAAMAILVVLVSYKPNLVKTEKMLVQHTRTALPFVYPLYYLDEVPFSARFYSFESAKPLKEQDVLEKMQSGQNFWLAISKSRTDLTETQFTQPIFANKRHNLYLINNTKQDALAAKSAQTGLIEPITQ
jgi:4-amino-4-deoxy-L-arabinose transferase-like glycosyltransferase